MNKIHKYGYSFRTVTESDAEFILGLRTDPTLSSYLSQTDSDINKQISWIREYKEREKLGQEYYFICETETGEPLGVFRIYNKVEDCVTNGSWIVKKGSPVNLPFVTDLFCHDFIFEELKMKKTLIDVRKENKKVVKYHLKFYNLYAEDDENIYLEMDYPTYLKKKKYLLSMLNL